MGRFLASPVQESACRGSTGPGVAHLVADPQPIASAMGHGVNSSSGKASRIQDEILSNAQHPTLANHNLRYLKRKGLVYLSVARQSGQIRIQTVLAYIPRRCGSGLELR